MKVRDLIIALQKVDVQAEVLLDISMIPHDVEAVDWLQTFNVKTYGEKKVCISVEFKG